MEANYTACEVRILVYEGGYTNDRADPGGCTNFGVTIGDAKTFWKSNANCADVKAMPKEVALKIIHDKYWNAVNAAALPSGVDDCVFDYGYNSGNSRAGKVLRRVLGLPDTDWHVTSLVIQECAKRDPVAIINAICDERMRFLEGLAIWPTYKNGWTTRVRDVRRFATQLANHTAPPVSNPPPKPSESGTPHTPKGQHPAPNTNVVVGGGGAAATGLAGVVAYFGAHPLVTALVIGAGAIVIAYIVSRMQDAHRAKQEAPTPGLIPVPELPPKG